MQKRKFEKIKKEALTLMEQTRDIQHDKTHLCRVEENVDVIVNKLKLDNQIDIFLLKAAVFLHDLSFIKHNAGFAMWVLEGRRTRRMVMDLLQQFELPEHEVKIIVEAVATHTLSFPLRRLNKKRNLYCQILQDADTLDMFTEIRISTLKYASRGKPFYKLLRILNKMFTKWCKKNLKYFLNFPSLTPQVIASKTIKKDNFFK